MCAKEIKRNLIAVNWIRARNPHAELYMFWCNGCRANVEMVTFAEAAKIIRTSLGSMVEQAVAGKLHLSFTPQSTLVCLDSLLEVIQVKSS